MPERLTTEQLFALQHAVRCHIKSSDRLVVKMGRLFPTDKAELNAAIGRVWAEIKLIEDAMAIVCRMFEAQFGQGDKAAVVGPCVTFQQRKRKLSGEPIAVVTGIDHHAKTITLSSARKTASKKVRK